MTTVMYCEDQTCACNHFGYCEYAFGIALDENRKCKAYIEREKKDGDSDESENLRPGGEVH